MKNIIKNITAALAILTFVPSCRKDLLDKVPNDRLSEEIFWKTENDAKLAVNALYTDLDGQNIFSWDALSDIAHTNQLSNTQTFIELGTYDVSNEKVYNEWASAYRGIRAANYFLENVDKVATTNKAILERFKGEARVLRAYQYIKLAGMFGDVPLITTSINLAEAAELIRTPVGDIWNFIDKELEEAAALVPATYAAADKGRITKGAAWGLKARADLWAGRYQAAVAATKNVTGYSLYGSYQNLFKYAGENNAEVILDKQFIKDNYQNSVLNLLAPFSQKSSQSLFVPTRALVDMYETSGGKNINDPGSGYDPAKPYVNRDPRLGFSIFVDGDILPSGIVFKPAPNSGAPDAIGATFVNSTTGFNIEKYITTEDYANPANGGLNIILLRYAEILLTYAEAKIELNELDQSVVDAINLVRNGRTDVKMPAIALGTQDEMRKIV
ncbi:MAG TPA: RagB/SusD family nutrient uptake outer membrane protein, partial [Flavitalea sp.]|nr:RagB/SusD family nutrient uptake outer membrane protein [Flavitalea sp.]